MWLGGDEPLSPSAMCAGRKEFVYFPQTGDTMHSIIYPQPLWFYPKPFYDISLFLLLITLNHLITCAETRHLQQNQFLSL